VFLNHRASISTIRHFLSSIEEKSLAEESLLWFRSVELTRESNAIQHDEIETERARRKGERGKKKEGKKEMRPE